MPASTPRLALALLLAAVPLAGIAQAKPRELSPAATPAGGSFRGFVEALWPAARERGVSRETFDEAFRGVVPDPKVMALTKKQAEFVKPVWDYLATAISANRVDKGRAAIRTNADLVANIERQYGVDGGVVLGVWGMETNFGGFTGGNDVVRALATLAHARYRGDYFRTELLNALVILEEGHVARASMTGSWAGAMGQTQFMPSSFKRFAVDGDGDGRKDIWTNVPDALASTANYLAKNGWEAGLPWGMEVALPEGFDFAASRGKRGFRDWSRLGVQAVDGAAPMPGSGEASLMLPGGSTGPAFLVTSNFRVIMRYNNSTSYALGVGLLGNRVKGAGPIQGSWPTGETPLGKAERTEVQHRLKTLGHYEGEVDGRLGEGTQEAIRSYQASAGMTPDGFPTGSLLSKLRGAR